MRTRRFIPVHYFQFLSNIGCWVCEFESRRGHGSLSLANAVFCQVEFSATGRSLVRGSPSECSMSECDLGTSTKVRPKLTRANEPRKPTATEAIHAVNT